MFINLLEGDCLDVLKTMEENSIDSIVTDPPYGISLMGKTWDYDVPSTDIWRECLRVVKPGGHLLSFSSTRTYHRMVVRIEDAGWEVRDMISWVYGSGFPKTMNLGEAVSKKDGTLGCRMGGWGTALKPAVEPICMARKPFEGTLTDNVIRYGTGGLNIDACRVPGESPSVARRQSARKTGITPGRPGEYGQTISDRTTPERYMAARSSEELGRFPSNFIHDGSNEVEAQFPLSGSSSAARFFFVAKPNKNEKEGSSHPSIKPVRLMTHLCQLVTPSNGVVLDPFAGSGSTGQGAIDGGFSCVMIERDASYCIEIRSRFDLFIL